MYVTLAARPLPKWFHLILSLLLFNLACAIVYVYILTRSITTSTERFEALPSYVVASLFFMSGCLSLSMTKSIISQNLRVAQVGVVLSLVTIVMAVVAIICILWLADIQDTFILCIYNVQHSQCICRNDNVTDARDSNWYVYEKITGCNRLDSLNRCMVASIALDAVGAFICFLAFSNFGLIWIRKKTGDGESSDIIRNYSLRSSSRRHPEDVGAHRSVSMPSSPLGTPGGHSDWDGWLFSHPLFRNMFSEFRHIWFPPSYEQSQMTCGATPNQNVHPTQISVQSVSSTGRMTPALPSAGLREPMLNVALGDYPPPPYSKSLKKKDAPVPKDADLISVTVQVTSPTTSSDSTTQTSENVISYQNCT